MDVAGVIFVISSFSRSSKGLVQPHVQRMLVAILVCIAASQCRNAIRFEWILEPAYMFLRYSLAILIFGALMKHLRTIEDLPLVLKPLAVAAIVTGVLSIAVALPGTRGIVTSYVFSNPLLEPASEAKIRKINFRENATRGVSLVGTSTITGGFLTTCWPAALLLTTMPRNISRLSPLLSQMVGIIAPFGALLTYSRTALLGLIAVFFTNGLLSGAKSRRNVAFGIVVIGAIVVIIGARSESFFFERLEQKSSNTFATGGLEAEGDRKRFLSFVEPFFHVVANPIFIAAGAGTTGTRLPRHLSAEERQIYDDEITADHSVFAKGYYLFGFTGSVLVVSLMISIWRQLLKHRRQVRGSSEQTQFTNGLIAIVAGMTPFFLFGHALISTVRGFSLLLIVLALTQSAVRIMNAHSQSSKPLT